jgi:hypothetical protein
MSDDDDDLKARVLRLTYQRILADMAGFAGFVDLRVPRRFVTREGLERTRRRIEHECDDSGAADDLVEYLTTAWLDRFAPRLM